MKMINTIFKPLPRREGEIAINARLLYLYVGHPHLPYEHWAASLHEMVASRGHVPRFRLMIGDDGELALNVDFATHFAQRVATDLMGVIALILIDEGDQAASRGDFEYTNRSLDQFRTLAMTRGWMHAKTLHTFIQVEKPFDDWLAELKKKGEMHYIRDYQRGTFGDQIKTIMHPKDTGQGELFFGPRFAMKVAAAEPTGRGRLVRLCVENFRA